MTSNNYILVTGVGGGSGLATTRILKETGYSVIAADCDAYANGFGIADIDVVIPRPSDASFLQRIKYLKDKYNISAIFPNVDDELNIFSQNDDLLPLIISNKATIKICLDKALTYSILKDKILLPSIYDINHIAYPAVVKPRTGRGSRNVHIINSENELLALLNYLNTCEKLGIDDVIIQEYLPGTEYTVDCLFDFNNNYIISVPRIRLVTKGGISMVGETVHNSKFDDIIRIIGNIIKFKGPINVQFKEDVSGNLKLIEINPRLSGGLPITYRAGVNIPDLAYRLFTYNEIEIPKYQDIRVNRYLTEIK